MIEEKLSMRRRCSIRHDQFSRYLDTTNELVLFNLCAQGTHRRPEQLERILDSFHLVSQNQSAPIEADIFKQTIPLAPSMF